MYYILNCRFDIHDTYLYQYKIEKETEKCIFYFEKYKSKIKNKIVEFKERKRVIKDKLNHINIRSDKEGTTWCEIYIATYSKPEDVQAGIEEIKRLRVEYLNKLANQKMEIERGD